MLAQLSIRNFAIVKALDLDLKQGMTTITGETGAGKSIAIDALGLCLGERAEAAMVRPGAERAELTALFRLDNDHEARRWLQFEELDSECPEECLLRRTISREGRSRAWINGRPVSLQQLRVLGSRLVAIHGQHAHQILLKPAQQQQLLDHFGGHQPLLADVRSACQQWQALLSEQHQLEAEQAQRQAQRQLLEYQVAELDQLALADGELEQLEQEHSRLAHAQSLLEAAQGSLDALDRNEDVNVLTLLRHCISRLEELADVDSQLTPILNQLHESQILLLDTGSELQRYESRIELDPARLNWLDERLEQVHQLARKHRVEPAALVEVHTDLGNTLAALQAQEEAADQLDERIAEARDNYLDLAGQLSIERQRSARKLADSVSQEIRQLALPHATFAIRVESLETETPRQEGLDRIEFQVTTNPGQPLASLEKVASGGELSRISLAIQVITANRGCAPTLIFDEVDTGISGATASVVGRLLKQLGESSQLLCVTHLPQVAGCGHQHLVVEKHNDGKQTETTMLSLSRSQRIRELARMLAGDLITNSSLASAEELLSAA